MVTSMVAESWVQVGASSLKDTSQALVQALQALQCPQDPKLIVALLAPNFCSGGDSRAAPWDLSPYAGDWLHNIW